MIQLTFTSGVLINTSRINHFFKQKPKILEIANVKKMKKLLNWPLIIRLFILFLSFSNFFLFLFLFDDYLFGSFDKIQKKTFSLFCLFMLFVYFLVLLIVCFNVVTTNTKVSLYIYILLFKKSKKKRIHCNCYFLKLIEPLYQVI